MFQCHTLSSAPLENRRKGAAGLEGTLKGLRLDVLTFGASVSVNFAPLLRPNR